MREVMHVRKQNPLSNLDKILQYGRRPRHNHLCTFWARSVKRFGVGGGGSNFYLSCLLWSLSLQHSPITVQVCDRYLSYKCIMLKGGRRRYHTWQSQSEEQDDRFPLQCRSPHNRFMSSNHVPKMSYGLLRNLCTNVKFAVNKHSEKNYKPLTNMTSQQ